MKKECEFFRDKLLDYSMDELDADIVEKVKAHLEICPDCWKIVDDYKKINSITVNVLKVDFSDDIWEMERKEIIRRVTQKIDLKKEIIRILKILFTVKRVLTAAVVTILLVTCITFGGIQYKKNQELNKEKIIIENIGLLENLEILERLDFYKKLGEKRTNL
ncbi:MAG: zf-HC2 domain-containing protein [Candidatus Goldbacteria bacterium]|nr:zf-HC2 domain-containing protein [Candidatus Goldiibacteriota bacterium]